MDDCCLVKVDLWRAAPAPDPASAPGIQLQRSSSRWVTSWVANGYGWNNKSAAVCLGKDEKQGSISMMNCIHLHAFAYWIFICMLNAIGCRQCGVIALIDKEPNCCTRNIAGKSLIRVCQAPFAFSGLVQAIHWFAESTNSVPVANPAQCSAQPCTNLLDSPCGFRASAAFGSNMSFNQSMSDPNGHPFL